MKSLLRLVLMMIFGLLVLFPANAAELSWGDLDSQSRMYFEAGEYPKALASGEKALAAAEMLYGPDHLNTAASMFNLAETYRRLGSYNNSESHYFGALRIRERILGREHSQVAACYYGLANIMAARGEYQLAEDYAGQALSVFQKTNGPANVEVGNVYTVLAEVNKGLLKYQEAESFGTQALETFEKTAGPDSLETAKALLLLASIRIKQEKYTEASALLPRAEVIYLKNYRKKRLETGNFFYCQAEILRLQGEPKKAQGVYKKALKYFEKLSKNDPDLGKTLFALAACRKSGLKYQKAEELQLQGLSILEGSVGPQSIILEGPIREMAELSALNRNYQPAVVYAYRLFKICEERYGTKGLKTADALNRLARIYLKSNRLSEAGTSSGQAIAIADSTGDSGNPEKATALLLMAKIKIRQGHFPAAQSDWEQASGLIKGFSENKPLLAMELLETEALLNVAQGNYLAAEPLLQKAIAEAEGVFGLFHSELAGLLKELSVLYRKEGRLKDAAAVEKRIKKIYSKIS